MSIAATWVWAPALFTSAEKAYLNGLPGLLWFLVPNVLCLFLFVPFAKRMREQMPDGVTLSGYMAKRYNSNAVKKAYQFQLLSIAALSTGVQLLAGAKILSTLTGYPFWAFTILLAVIAYSYAQHSGIEASVLTDAVQMIIMLGCCALLVGMALSNGDGIAAMVDGLAPSNGAQSGWNIFWAFGLPTTIGLMSAPFGDQSFWQRAFSIKRTVVGKAFALGALLFLVVPASMGVIGLVASGSGYLATDSGLVNLELVSSIFPDWAMLLFVVMLLSGLLSTVDSNLCAVASLTSDWQVTSKLKNPEAMRLSRLSMVALLVVSILISNIPGLTVTHLFLIYGTLRATTMLPTVLTLRGKRLTAGGVWGGVTIAMVVGMPLFILGTITGNTALSTAGCLCALLLSGVVCVATAPRAEVRHG